MKHAIELTARNTWIRVEIDGGRWPRKTAEAQAKEALAYLGRAIAAAIEGAPQVGVARELVDISPMDHGAESQDRPELPTAPRVGARTWEAVEAAIRAVKLPEGIELKEYEFDEKQLKVRHTSGAREALFWLTEVVAGEAPHEPEVSVFEINVAFEPDQIEARVLEAAKSLLKKVADRDKPGVADGSPPTEDATDEAK
jgi:hypothetical protein